VEAIFHDREVQAVIPHKARNPIWTLSHRKPPACRHTLRL